MRTRDPTCLSIGLGTFFTTGRLSKEPLDDSTMTFANYTMEMQTQLDVSLRLKHGGLQLAVALGGAQSED